MSDARERWAKIRASLEQADRDLVSALEARAAAMRSYAELRRVEPTGFFPVPAPDEVLGRLRELRREFPERALDAVVREVVNASNAVVAPIRVAVAGSEAGLAEVAAHLQFGALVDTTAVSTVHDALLAVDRGEATYALVPLETSTDGASSETLFALVNGQTRIVAERTVPNAFFLLSRTGNPADVEKIYATPAALAATSRTIEHEFPRATVLEVRASSVATPLVTSDHGSAVVACRPEVGDLRVVRAHLEHDVSARTRFLVVGRDAPRRTGSDRTVLALSLAEAPGSLYAALAPFADRTINLTRLESRQVPGSPIEQVFFVELDGHVSDRSVLSAIDEVKAKSRHLKVLGSYPRPTP